MTAPTGTPHTHVNWGPASNSGNYENTSTRGDDGGSNDSSPYVNWPPTSDSGNYENTSTRRDNGGSNDSSPYVNWPPTSDSGNYENTSTRGDDGGSNDSSPYVNWPPFSRAGLFSRLLQEEIDTSSEDNVGLVARSSDRLAGRTSALETEVCRFFVGGSSASFNNSSVGFINQGNITLLECRAQATQLFGFSEDPIDVIYSGSNTGRSSEHISPGDPRIRLLHRSWNDFFNCPHHEERPGNITGVQLLRLQICAGDSVYIVRRALELYSEVLRKFIMIIAIAPSCEISSNLCFLVRHYRAQGDLFSVSIPEYSHNSYFDIIRKFEIVPRSNESRGLFDWMVHSSSFQALLYLEMGCFALRQRLVIQGRLPSGYDRDVQILREQCLERLRAMSGIGYSDEAREEALLMMVRAFFLTRSAEVAITNFNNLYEEAELEIPRSSLETTISISSFASDQSLIIAGTVAHLNSPASLAWMVFPVLEVVRVIRRSVVYGGTENNSCNRLIRVMGMRFGSLDGVIWVCEAGAFTFFIFNNPWSFSLDGILFGSHLVFTGLELAFQMIVQFDRPLRGRIQAAITEVGHEDIRTERTHNEEAMQVGRIQRLGRAVVQMVRGTEVLVIAGACMGALVTNIIRREDRIVDPSADEESGHIPDLILMGMWSVTGIVATTSLIASMVQIRRLRRRLRDRGQPRQDAEVAIELATINRTTVRNQEHQPRE